MSITICEDCGKKYVEKGTICDSCQDIRDTVRKIELDEIIADQEQRWGEEKDQEWEDLVEKEKNIGIL